MGVFGDTTQDSLGYDGSSLDQGSSQDDDHFGVESRHQSSSSRLEVPSDHLHNQSQPVKVADNQTKRELVLSLKSQIKHVLPKVIRFTTKSKKHNFDKLIEKAVDVGKKEALVFQQALDSLDYSKFKQTKLKNIVQLTEFKPPKIHHEDLIPKD